MPTSTLAPNQVANFNIDAFMELSRIAFSSVEKLTALNLEVSRTAVEQGVAASRANLDTDHAQGQTPVLGELPATVCRNAQDYVQQLQAIANQTRQEVADLLASYQASGGEGSNPGADWLRSFDMFKSFAQQINAMTDSSSKIVGKATENLKKAQSAAAKADA